MSGRKIRIVKKKNDYSLEYQVGDIFSVDSMWYGGVNVTSKTGIPLSLDREEYVEYEEAEETEWAIDPYSYELGVMDCFCEMVWAGLKTLAMSHPCGTREERDAYLPEVKKLCEKYQIQYYPEDEALITDLFPEELNKDTFNYLFYRGDHVLERYLELKKRKKRLTGQGEYRAIERFNLAMEFGRLLSYPEEAMRRMIRETEKRERV